MRPQSGLSLVEVLVAIVIAGLLLTFALPAFQSMQARRAVSGAMDILNSDFAYARSEAIKRGNFVTVCSSDNGSVCLASNEWGAGWIIYEGGASATVPAGSILRVQGPPAGIASLTATDTSLTFRPNGTGYATAGHMRVTPHADTAQDTLVCISAAGRVRQAPQGSTAC